MKGKEFNGLVVITLLGLFIASLFNQYAGLLFMFVIAGWVAYLMIKEKVEKYLPKQNVTDLDKVGNKPIGDMPTGRIVAGEISSPAITVDTKWFDVLVKNAVHILVIGETDSGKSTAAKAILNARASRGEQIIILDPHARPSTWCGLEAVGKGRDYEAIEHMLQIIKAEMTNRYRLYAEDDTYNPVRLNIFIDEIPSIATTCDTWQEFFTVLSCEARKVNMSLVCLTQSRLVDMLGIKGRSDVRENFSELLLGDKAIKVIPDASKQSRPAVVDHKGKVSIVDTSMLPAIGNNVISSQVLWIPDVNLVPENGAQTAMKGITTRPLTDEEKQLINDWVAEYENTGVTRYRVMLTKRLYEHRGGQGAYDGRGTLYQIVAEYLNSDEI